MYTAALGWMPALPRILRVIASGRESDRGESPLDFLHGPTGCGGTEHLNLLRGQQGTRGL